MFALVAQKRKQKSKDRKRKKNLVRCECHFCKGRFRSPKIARRHNSTFNVVPSSDDSNPDYSDSGCDQFLNCRQKVGDLVEETTNCKDKATLRCVSECDKNSENELVLESSPSPIQNQIEISDNTSSCDSVPDRDSEDSSEGDCRSSVSFLARSDASDPENDVVESGEELENQSTASSSESEKSNDRDEVDEDTEGEVDVRATLPLYDGSPKTVLEVLAGYFHWFTTHPSISKTALSNLLHHEHFNVLPTGNNLPSSYGEAYNFVKPYLLPTVCFHVCPNDCILFRKTARYDYSNLKKCPTCNADRYSANGRPIRRFIYYPLEPRWKRLFECAEVSRLLQEHDKRSSDEGDVMIDVHDSVTWKENYGESGLFKGDPRGLSIQLSTDGVNPFSVNRQCYSMWPIMVTILNWPKSKRNNFEKVMLAGIVPANKKDEPKSLDPYLEVVVDELLELSDTICYDDHKKENFTLRVHLHNYVLDYPGLNKVFCCNGSGALQGCMWCEMRGTHVAALDKVVYLQNRRFLPNTHKLRKAKKNFPFNATEHRPPPKKLTGEEIMSDSLAYEYAKNPTQAAGFATATGSKGCHCFMLLPQHDRTMQAFPDAMHLVKNVTAEMVQLINGHKDNKKVRKAEHQLGRFKGSCMSESDERSNNVANLSGAKTKEKLPEAPFRLTVDDMKIADKRAKSVQVPVGYGWTPTSLFLKHFYTKSHDWKQLVCDGILKFTLHNLLEKTQRTTLFRLFDVLSALCNDVQDKGKLAALEQEANLTLALIERDFPISVQTISVHIVHHLAAGISAHGPVHSWWMYVYERMNSWICRRVKNRCHPEVNVMETYRIFDWCQHMKLTGQLALKGSADDNNDDCFESDVNDSTSKVGKLDMEEFLALKQNSREYELPPTLATSSEALKSFRRAEVDSVSCKSSTWIAAGREQLGKRVSSIVAVSGIGFPRFGEVLYFVSHKVFNEYCTETVCINIFDQQSQDKETCLWIVKTSAGSKKLVPLNCISKPLVTARDDIDNTKLWILSFKQ